METAQIARGDADHGQIAGQIAERRRSSRRPHPIPGIEFKVWRDAQPAPSPTACPNSTATWPAWASTPAG